MKMAVYSMDNEPPIEFVGSINTITQYQTPDGMWIITDTKTGVTTQAQTRVESLLMLADALAAYEDTGLDLMESAEDIFVMDEETQRFLESELDADIDSLME